MYEDCIVKKQVFTLEECQEMSEKFLEQIKVCEFSKGIKGYGANRRQFSVSEIICQEKMRKFFELTGCEIERNWVSVFYPPCDLPLHVDPPVKNWIRLIALLQKPETGANVIICKKKFENEKIIPLEVGDVYQLPADKYYHGVSFFDKGVPRVIMGFDFKIKETTCLV
jgi:hypothetical protein